MSALLDLDTAPCPFCAIAAASPPTLPDPLDTSPDLLPTSTPTTSDPPPVEQPANVFLSTPRALAFLDIQPLASAAAHVLLIPRAHHPTLPALTADPPAAAALGALLPVVARALRDVLGSHDFNVVQNNGPGAGQLVDHVHFHVIARRPVRFGGEEEEGETRPEDTDETRRIARNLLAGAADYGADVRARLSYAAQVYGRGPREDLDDAWARRLVPQLHARVSQLLRPSCKL